MSIEADKLLSIPEVARRLELSTDGVYKLIQRGKLEAIRISERKTRVSQSTLDHYAAQVQARVDRYLKAQRSADAGALQTDFERETGRSAEAWLAAWKRDEIKDTPTNLRLLARAASLREAEQRHTSART